MSTATWILAILFVCGLVTAASDDGREEVSIEIRMPKFEVQEEDTYLCTSIQLPEAAMKLKAFEPLSDQDTVHHMLLFGCTMPSSNDSVWECQHKPSCKNSETVMYGWGRNAEKLMLPDGVAYSVGKNTNVQFVVLQIHYLIKRPKDDNSGLIIKLTKESSMRTASMLMFVSSFAIEPQKEKFPVHDECCYSGFEPVTTVAFRVHTHEMGRNVYMTKTSGRSPYGDVIARRHPLLPQGFVSVPNQTMIFPGERLKVTCDFDSTDKTEVVVAGFTHNDEMCNMYMMVHSEIPHFGICSDGYGFADEETNPLGRDSKFVKEQELSKQWKGPDATTNALIGEVVAVDRGHDGRIWMLHRGENTMAGSIEADSQGRYQVKDHALVSENTVLVLNSTTGETLSQWGANLFSIPHMLTIDTDGNVWITDVGRHQVFKFSSEGELLMTLGEAFVAGNNATHFCSPTQVAVLTDGSFLISDGYCNRRLAKFNADGEFLFDVDFVDGQVPHSLLPDECADVLLVANRFGHTLRVYGLSDLTLLGELDMTGEVMALARGPFDTFLVMSTKDLITANITQLRLMPRQIFVEMSWEIPSVSYPHDLLLSAAPVELTGPGNRLFAVYIAEVSGKKLSKFILVPPSYGSTEKDDDVQVQEAYAQTQIEEEAEVDDAQLDESYTETVNEPHPTFHELKQTTPNAPHLRLFMLFFSASVIVAAIYFLRKKRFKRSILQHYASL